jgi:hypothetical protein
MSETSMIYGSLAAVMEDCSSVAKRDRNTHQNFMFRGIDAVVNAVGPILRKHAVVVAPNVERCDYDTVQTSTGKPATACRVLVTYTFYATDGSSVDCRVAAEAWDSGDKAAPKAMSVAFRTALLQALALPTDEPDPDSQSYERENDRRAERVSGVQTDQWSTTPSDPKQTLPMSDRSRARMFALFGEQKITDEDEQRRGISAIIHREIASRGEITEGECQAVIAVLAARPKPAPTAPEEAS